MIGVCIPLIQHNASLSARATIWEVGFRFPACAAAAPLLTRVTKVNWHPVWPSTSRMGGWPHCCTVQTCCAAFGGWTAMTASSKCFFNPPTADSYLSITAGGVLSCLCPHACSFLYVSARCSAVSQMCLGTWSFLAPPSLIHRKELSPVWESNPSGRVWTKMKRFCFPVNITV